MQIMGLIILRMPNISIDKTPEHTLLNPLHQTLIELRVSKSHKKGITQIICNSCREYI